MISFSAANYLIFFTENRARFDWKLKQLSLHFATIIDKKNKIERETPKKNCRALTCPSPPCLGIRIGIDKKKEERKEKRMKNTRDSWGELINYECTRRRGADNLVPRAGECLNKLKFLSTRPKRVCNSHLTGLSLSLSGSLVDRSLFRFNGTVKIF